MSDYELPELPSDEELGISEDDLEDVPDEAPEMSAEERAALLGEAPADTPPPGRRAPTGDTTPKARKAKGTAEPTQGREAAAPAGPKRRWRGPITLGALVVVAFLSSSFRTLPRPAPANAPDTAFSSARAMAHLVEVARRAHPPGSPEHARVRAYLVERLRDLGVEPEIQVATPAIGRGSFVRAATVRNIVARIPGTASTGAIVLTAHYDGRGTSTAAGDDGMGVVTILETLRALRAGPPPTNDVVALITDGEELGLLGARAFVDEHPWMADVAVVLSVEMRGGGGASVMFETGERNGWIVRALAEGDPRPFANSMSYEVYRRMPNDTDFTPFREAGKQGLNFAGVSRASLYHQAYDTPSNVSEATLQHHGLHLLGMVRTLAHEDLTDVHAPDVTFFSLPGVGMVVYGLDLVLPLTASMVLLAILLLLPLRATGGRWSGIFAGLALAVASMGLAAGVGAAMMAWLPRFHPEYGSLHGGTFHDEGWYVLALAAAVFTLVTALFGLARRWLGAAELAWGALLVPMSAAVALSIAAPAAAMNLQWPVVAALLATLVCMLPASKRALATIGWGLRVLLVIPVLAFLVPITEFLWLGFGFSQAMALGAFLAVVMLLLFPALDRLREPNAWWAPVAGVVAAAAFITLGVSFAAPDASRPAPSTLAYAFDRGTGEALWVTDASLAPVDEEARLWAEARAGVSFDQRRSLPEWGLGDREYRVAPAEPVAASPPEVWMVEDSTDGSTRRIRLALRSAVGAELLQLHFPEGGTTVLTHVGGRPVPVEVRPSLVEHWGEPRGAIYLDVELPAGGEPELAVVEHLLRPGEILGDPVFERPPTLAPDVVWLSDRAVLRTPFAYVTIRDDPAPVAEGVRAVQVAGEGEPGPAMPSGADDPAADSLLSGDTVPEPADTLARTPDGMS
jgi:hypothetical protein